MKKDIKIANAIAYKLKSSLIKTIKNKLNIAKKEK